MHVCIYVACACVRACVCMSLCICYLQHPANLAYFVKKKKGKKEKLHVVLSIPLHVMCVADFFVLRILAAGASV